MNSTFEFPAGPDDLLYPAIFLNDKAYFLTRGTKLQASIFGGPLPDIEIHGPEHGPRKLHHLLTIGGDCLEPIWKIVGGHTLYLMYGFCFDGCQLTYRSRGQSVEILEMRPTQSSPNWPYPNYPEYLPYFPLRLEACVDCTKQQFSRIFRGPLEANRNEAIVVVPASQVLGMSLWGPAGDAEGVQIVFRCEMVSDGIVRVENQ